MKRLAISIACRYDIWAPEGAVLRAVDHLGHSYLISHVRAALYIIHRPGVAARIKDVFTLCPLAGCRGSHDLEPVLRPVGAQSAW